MLWIELNWIWIVCVSVCTWPNCEVNWVCDFLPVACIDYCDFAWDKRQCICGAYIQCINKRKIITSQLLHRCCCCCHYSCRCCHRHHQSQTPIHLLITMVFVFFMPFFSFSPTFLLCLSFLISSSFFYEIGTYKYFIVALFCLAQNTNHQFVVLQHALHVH